MAACVPAGHSLQLLRLARLVQRTAAAVHQPVLLQGTPAAVRHRALSTRAAGALPLPAAAMAAGLA